MQIEYGFFEDFLKLLLKHQVEAMIIGGYAVNVYGYSRYTGDLDIWYQPTSNNVSKLMKAIEEFGFDTEILKNQQLEYQSPIKLQDEGFKIELIASIKGVGSFDECYQNVLKVEINDFLFPFIGYKDLINNKKSSMRMKDAVDVHYLEQIKKLNNPDSES
ncbi:nucleotidyltransferase [Cytophagales bacterium LB-30]|uniref:Nucleotidyltransferase n=1 Tax=Shiella aurantiaca TaxID=3058365 RepID=A0ABT8F619_9BACT|nr:nucleotidyltransferase [Shiella aurantiaca]MDN4165753.1 nucleotidyltransferase [Shiella aurantiaca]